MWIVDEKCGKIKTQSKCFRDIKSRSCIFPSDLTIGKLALTEWVKASILGESWIANIIIFVIANYFYLFNIFFVIHTIFTLYIELSRNSE